MKKSLLVAAVIGSLFAGGCKGLWGNDNGGGGEDEVGGNDQSAKTPKEIAAENARRVYGKHKPYTYTWRERKGKYVIYGQALVVPGKPYLSPSMKSNY